MPQTAEAQLKELPHEQQKQAAEKALEQSICRENLIHHLENHFFIKDQQGKLRLMKPLKKAQLYFLALREAAIRQELPLWFIVLKARKEGMSTLIEALGFIEARDHEKDMLVIAHDEDTTKKIFEITNRFYQNYDLRQPDRPNPSTRAMKFTGQEGSVMVQTAGNVHAGTGLTPHFLHCSEVAKWKRGDETSTALLQSIQENEETTVVLESTAQSYDSLFHPIWENAYEHCKVHFSHTAQGIEAEIEVNDPEFQWNGYIPLFIPWFDDPDYTKPFRTESRKQKFRSILNTQKKEYMERFELTLEQMHWYETTCLNKKCKGKPHVRHQEYPATPEEAFIHSGHPRFDMKAINAWELEDGVRGHLRQEENYRRTVKFVRDEVGRILVFSGPKPGHHYVMSLDPAEGLDVEQARDPDETVLHVYDITTPEGIEQVAACYGQIREEELVEPAHMLHLWYNQAFIVGLQTGGYGQHFNEQMMKLVNPMRIFRQDGRLGLKEHAGNKAALVSMLAEAVRDGSFHVKHRKTAKQFRLYVDQRGKLKASKGHDDHVSAAYAGVYGAQHYPWPLVQGIRPKEADLIPGTTYARPHSVRADMDDWSGYTPC